MTGSLIWTPWGLPGISSGVATFVLAAIIWRTTRSRPIRNRFSLLLVVEGIGTFFGLLGAPQFFLQAEHHHTVLSVHFMNDCLLLAFYLPALAVAVDSPMLKPFRNGIGRWLLTGYGLTLFAAVAFAEDTWVATTIPGIPGYGAPHVAELGPLMGLVFLSLAISYFYGLIATILAWRKAETEISRRKTGILALAFGARDIGAILLYVFGALMVLSGVDQSDPQSIQQAFYACLVAYTGSFIYVCLV